MSIVRGAYIDIDLLADALDNPSVWYFAVSESVVSLSDDIGEDTNIYYGNFQYDSEAFPTVITGEITRITGVRDLYMSNREWEVSGISISVDELRDTTLEMLLAGDDAVYGVDGSPLWIDETLYGYGGADQMFGLLGADALYGGTGNDVIDGGSGADAMYGQTDNDTYFIDNAGDTIHEVATEGYDKAWTTISYTLAAGVEVEELLLLDSGATTALSLTGNEFGQFLRGNNGANILDGKGGADTLRGFGGNDSYYVDHVGDVVVEAALGGVDTIYSAITFALTATQEIETLRTVNVNATTAINLIGNAGGQSIFGNIGVNKLLGQGGNDNLYAYGGADQLYGGEGNDILSGGAGNDSFVFNTALNAADNVDRILEFSNGTGNDDRILIDNAFFAKLTATGIMNAAFFKANAAGVATDVNDYILYETDTGKLFYDADGNGAGAAVLFATLTGAPVITHTDFVVI